MSIIYKTGDLFTSEAGAIGHGVNCVGAMASGIAVEFRKRFPEMHEQYVEECKYGLYSMGVAFSYYEDREDIPTVINITSQFYPGASARYDAAISGIFDALSICKSHGISTLAIPRIACGVGGLDWNVMKVKLEREFSDNPVDLEIWSLG